MFVYMCMLYQFMEACKWLYDLVSLDYLVIAVLCHTW